MTENPPDMWAAPGGENNVPAAWPNRLTVGVRAPGISGGGHLLVAPGQLICELGPVSRRVSGIDRVAHAGRHVHIFRARLVPFWFNVAAVIDDGHVAVLASKSAFGFRGLVAAARRAGYEVTVHKTWLDRGQSLGAPHGVS